MPIRIEVNKTLSKNGIGANDVHAMYIYYIFFYKIPNFFRLHVRVALKLLLEFRNLAVLWPRFWFDHEPIK